MALQQERNHWFSFRDACVSVMEKTSVLSHGQPEYTLFFLHGRFGQAAMWRPLIREFSASFRCIAIDLPGFGNSFCVKERGFSLNEHTGLVREIIRQMTQTYEKVILVGHDVGGGVAQLCGLNSPEKVAALVLINSACVTRQLNSIPIGFRGFLARWKLNQLFNQAEKLSQAHRLELGRPWDTQDSRTVLSRSVRAVENSWPWHYEKQTLKGFFRTLSLPVLLLWGSHDSLNSPEIGIEMVQKLPEAYFFENEGAGHWPNLEQTQWVLSKMKEFMFKASFGSQVNVQKFLLR